MKKFMFYSLFFVGHFVLAAGNGSGSSTPTTWIDPVLQAKISPIKAVHITQLRSIVNSNRLLCSLPPTTWTDDPIVPKMTPIKKSHIDELRASVSDLISAHNIAVPANQLVADYTDPNIVSKFTVIKAAHITQLRTLAEAASCPLPPAVYDGVCGAANGVASASAPAAGLCAVGAASAVAGAGPWTWSCAGSGGGISDSCSAPLAGGGVCGTSHLATVPFSPPAASLCSAGAASAPAWDASDAYFPEKWNCVGSTTDSCKARSPYTWTYCFVAGTQVTLKSGATKNIEDIKVGEEVQTYDEATQQMISSPVEKVFHHEEKFTSLYTFHIGEKTLTSNDQHRFFLPKEETYFSAEEVFEKWKHGEKIILLNDEGGHTLVSEIEYKYEKVPLFNIHVKGRYDKKSKTPNENLQLANHNYFANGVLVHNVKLCGGMSANADVKNLIPLCKGANPCDVTSNIMQCAFKNPTDQTNYETCMSAQYAALGGSACTDPVAPSGPGACGTSNGVPTATIPTDPCASGTLVPIPMSTWSWTCVGTSTASCSAPYNGTWHKYKILGSGDYACNLGGPYPTQAGCGPPGCASCGCMPTAWQCSNSGPLGPWP